MFDPRTELISLSLSLSLRLLIPFALVCAQLFDIYSMQLCVRARPLSCPMGVNEEDYYQDPQLFDNIEKYQR